MRQAFQRARTVLVVLGAAWVTLAQAQPAVTKVVVPFPAGGVTDQAARILAESLSRQLGETFIVENRPGAGSRLGVEAVLRAPADGKTLLFTNSSYSILAVVDPKLSFDPAKALLPVNMTATYGLQIVTRKDSPATSLRDFIAHAKKHPDKLSYGSAGVGSGSHFAGEYFKSLTGASLVHVPYKSTNGALSDVAGSLLDLAFDAASKPLVDAGRVKLLAVTGSKRDPRFPQAPTAVEAGLAGFALDSWVGLLAPVGTPEPVRERLAKAAAAAAADPGTRSRLADMGLEAAGGEPSRLRSAIKDDLTLYRKIAAAARLNFDE